MVLHGPGRGSREGGKGVPKEDLSVVGVCRSCLGPQVGGIGALGCGAG